MPASPHYIALLLLLSAGTPFLVQGQSPTPSTAQVPARQNTSVSADEVTAPEYPGGEEGMLKLLAQNARYPSQAHIAKNVGRAIMQITIDAEGRVRDVKAAHADNPYFEKEGARVLKLMTNWKPAEINGSPVSSTYLFPFTFQMRGADGNELPLPKDHLTEVHERFLADAPHRPVYLAEEIVIVGLGVVRAR